MFKELKKCNKWAKNVAQNMHFLAFQWILLFCGNTVKTTSPKDKTVECAVLSNQLLT